MGYGQGGCAIDGSPPILGPFDSTRERRDGGSQLVARRTLLEPATRNV
jgi:hypothetical protein